MKDETDTSTIELELVQKKKLGRPLEENRNRAASSTDRSKIRRQKILDNMALTAENWDIGTCRAILNSDQNGDKHDDAIHRYAAIKNIKLQQQKAVQMKD